MRRGKHRVGGVRLGLALGGGGAKGLSHIAFLKVLDGLGIKPAAISGTSIGALIGGLYAFGLSGGEIEKLFTDLGLLEMGRMLDISWRARSGLIKGEKLMSFMRRLVHGRRIEELTIPLKIVATDFWKRVQVVLDRGDLVEAVRASVSIPGIFEPVSLGDRILIDGGVVNPLPYDVIRRECDLLVAVDVSGQKTPPEAAGEKPNVFECILSSFQILEAAVIESKMRLSQPDLVLKPRLQNVRVLEFYRVREILEGVQAEAALLEGFLREKLDLR